MMLADITQRLRALTLVPTECGVECVAATNPRNFQMFHKEIN